jgi:hypothetical protein
MYPAPPVTKTLIDLLGCAKENALH